MRLGRIPQIHIKTPVRLHSPGPVEAPEQRVKTTSFPTSPGHVNKSIEIRLRNTVYLIQNISGLQPLVFCV